MPFVHDQPLWARRLVTLGAAPCAVTVRSITGRHLTAAITQAVNDARHGQAATAIARQLQHEDGAAQVLDTIDQLLRI